MSETTNHLHVRVDASSEMGTGHLTRCLALAQYWLDEIGAVTFIGHCPDALAPRLAREGIEHIDLAPAHPDPEDLKRTARLIPPHTPVVLDGYHFDRGYQEGLSGADRRVLVVDDTGHLPGYAGSVLLNQNVHAQQVDYGDAPDVKLLGPGHALLSRRFRALADRTRVNPAVARRILLTLGGADPENVTLDLMRRLTAIELEDTAIRVVVGPAYRHEASLATLCAAHPRRFSLVTNANMPAQMGWADVAISSSGTTSLELAFMGLPSILIAIADNQVPLAAGFEAEGVAVNLGTAAALEQDRFAAALLDLLGDAAARGRMSERGRALVDGQGVARVAAALRS